MFAKANIMFKIKYQSSFIYHQELSGVEGVGYMERISLANRVQEHLASKELFTGASLPVM